MNKCLYCNVNIENDKSHCPLCGKCCNEECSTLNQERMPRGRYPIYRPTYSKQESVVSILIKMLLLALVVVVAVELLSEQTVHLSLYGIVGVAFVILNVLLPIMRKNNMSGLIAKTAFYLSGLLVFIELYSQTFGWGVNYVIPFTLLGLAVLGGILGISSGYVRFDMVKPLFIIAILSTVLLILVMLFKCVVWPSLTVAFVSWGLIALLFMFRFKRMLKNLKKDLRI